MTNRDEADRPPSPSGPGSEQRDPSDPRSRDQSQAGYPEEGPPGSEPTGGDAPPSEESPQRRGGKQPGGTEEPGDDGTATGNPHSAG